MRRKVIKQGHNTLTLTLPSDWVKKYQVKPGDELDILEQNSSLIVNAKKEIEVARTVVDVTGLSIPLVWRYVSSAYRAGYDEIKIIFDETKDYKHLYTAFSYNTMQHLYEDKTPEFSPVEAIQALVNRFIGVEIIDQRKNYCIVKELGETTYKEFDNALRRIFLLLLHMADETVNALESGDYTELKSVHMVDTNLDRFEDFCLRVLNKKGYSEFRKSSTMYSLIFLLELIGDEYKKIALHLLESKASNKNLLKNFKIQQQQLRRFYELFYNFNKEKTLEIFNEDKIGDKLNRQTFAKMSTEEKELLHHLKKIGIYILSLTELRIDMEF